MSIITVDVFFMRPQNWHLPFTYVVNILHQLSSHLCQLCVDRQSNNTSIWVASQYNGT